MSASESELQSVIASFRSGDRGPATYAETLCDRIERIDPEIRALIPESDRRGRLSSAVGALEKRSPEFEERPPLYGVPIGVKDIIHVDGFPTRAGTEVPPNQFGGPEAAVVSRLRRAGAIILGKTVTTEFALSAPGPTRNPIDHGHTPGGSSSGSAAAVAAGLCPIAIGTQTNGSVIRPASFCGVVGFKPSFERIPMDGVITVSPSTDHLGLFTRSVRDMQTAASIACLNWKPVDQRSRPTLGVVDGPYLEQATQQTQDAFEGQVARLTDAGYEVKRATAFDDIDAVNRHQKNVVAGEVALEFFDVVEDHEEALRDRTADRFRGGYDVSARAIAEARRHQLRLRDRLESVMDEQGIDLWLSPAAPGPAPEGIDDTGDPVMNKPWTHAGVPVLTIPAGSIDELPLGLQLAAPFGADETLLSWGAVLEDAL